MTTIMINTLTKIPFMGCYPTCLKCFASRITAYANHVELNLKRLCSILTFFLYVMKPAHTRIHQLCCVIHATIYIRMYIVGFTFLESLCQPLLAGEVYDLTVFFSLFLFPQMLLVTLLSTILNQHVCSGRMILPCSSHQPTAST